MDIPSTENTHLDLDQIEIQRREDERPFNEYLPELTSDRDIGQGLTSVIADHLDTLKAISHYYQRPLPEILDLILTLGEHSETNARKITQKLT
jgi:hypothetical protein